MDFYKCIYFLIDGFHEGLLSILYPAFFRSFLLKEVKGIDSWLEAIIGLALSCSFDGKL